MSTELTLLTNKTERKEPTKWCVYFDEETGDLITVTSKPHESIDHPFLRTTSDDARKVLMGVEDPRKFAVIDVNWLSLPNVRGIGFNEHEGSYLVGMLAAQASKTGTVGFVGGMDIPLIRRFGCGYAQGVKAVNPNATVIANMTGTTPAAWNDPVKGCLLYTSPSPRDKRQSRMPSSA